MADNSKKISELPTAANVASTDRILVLRSPSSNASVRTVTANDFANSTKLSFAAIIPNTTVISNSVVLASNGTNSVAFLTYAIANGKTGCCEVTVHARDAITDSTTAAHIIVVANTSNAVSSVVGYAQIGSPIIDFNVSPVYNSNTVTLYFTRGAAATSNVNLRFSATIY